MECTDVFGYVSSHINIGIDVEGGSLGGFEFLFLGMKRCDRMGGCPSPQSAVKHPAIGHFLGCPSSRVTVKVGHA